MHDATATRLLPVSRLRDVSGYPYSRRTTSRLIRQDPDFPRVVRLNNRLFVEAKELEKYLRVLIQRGIAPLGA